MLIRRAAGAENNYLEINLYRNQLQLATDDALYSDGHRYVPAVTATKKLKKFLPYMRTVLVLGAGLCSMVHVIRRKEFDPCFTLVEKDKVVLEWAMEILEPSGPDKTQPVCSDAEVFMQKNTEQYDFVFIDVLMGRVVPDFVLTKDFLQRCRNSLTDGGHVAFNYIVNNEHEWERARTTFTDVFPEHDILKNGLNRILIGKVSAGSAEQRVTYQQEASV